MSTEEGQDRRPLTLSDDSSTHSGKLDDKPLGRADRRLDRVLRIVDDGPRPFYRAAAISLAVTSVLAMAIAALLRPQGPLPATQRQMMAVAMAGVGLSVILWVASLAGAGRSRPGTWLDRVAAPEDRAAIWLALAVWFPFLLLVVYYRAMATFPPSARYVYFPFKDKRWETTAYLLGVLAPAILLTTAARVLIVGRGKPPTWSAWLTGLFRAVPGIAAVTPDVLAEGHTTEAAGGLAGGPRSGARGLLPMVSGLATALGLAWYLTGPPWYLSKTSTPISHQEEVVLIGLQAVAKGHLPYVGVASVQYGPGTQVLVYWLMRHVTSFSVVGFREAWALLVWGGVSVVFAVFFLAFGYARGLAVSVLSALVYPALHQVAFQPGGSFSGYFGWASALRYAGLIALVLLLPAVIGRCPGWRGTAAGTAVGVLWGLTSYLAQENLAGGAVGALAVGGLLLLSGSASWRAVRTGLDAVLAGFLVIWTPILVYYAFHGQLAEFLQQYLLFPKAVASGANNTPWGGFTHLPSPYSHMFFVLPFLLAGLAVLAVVRIRPLRIATQWPRERVLLLVTVLATALLYEGVLLRSDTSHLTGTLLMVPALVIMTATVLPRLLGAKRGVAVALAGVALTIASLVLLPSAAFAPASLRSWAEAPLLDRQRLAAVPASGKPETPAGQRVGAGLEDASQCCQGSRVPMPEFVRLMQRIHTIVGNRTAYVASFHGDYPGLIYFGADLNPAPISSDPYSSIETEAELTAFLADFRTRVLPQTQAVLTASVDAPEARYFLRRYPNARRITVRYGGSPYYILLRQN